VANLIADSLPVKQKEKEFWRILTAQKQKKRGKGPLNAIAAP
jgi:hypothetical protein